MRSEQPLLLINVVGLTPSLLGEATPHINALLKTAQMAHLQPVFPAVTSTVRLRSSPAHRPRSTASSAMAGTFATRPKCVSGCNPMR